MIRALLMDVDGVLVRGRLGEDTHWSFLLYDDLGIRMDDLRRRFFRKAWADVVEGRRSLARELEPVLRELAPEVTPRQLMDYWFERDSDCDREMLAVLDLCRERGLRVELATNQEHERARHLMQVVGLERHVDAINYSAAMGCRKPDPAFFEAIAGRLEMSPSELLFFDDAQENVEAARELGWHGVHWTGNRSFTEELCDAGIVLS